MNKSTRTILMTAAVAGLYAGAFAVKASASTANAGCAITQADDKAHDCAGKNDCKGKGGCKSGDQGCKGKNTCKGKGGCASAHKEEKK